jgi:hypothetical protein
MLNVQKLPLNQPASERIKKWLGADGARDFMDYLIDLDASLSAESANLLVQSEENDANLEDARSKARGAAEIRRFIELLNASRDPDFKFERCSVSVCPISVIT